MVRLTDRPDMTLDVYRGCKTTMQQQQQFHTVSDLIFLVGLCDLYFSSIGSVILPCISDPFK